MHAAEKNRGRLASADLHANGAAYRPELDPNTLQLFNDMAWLIIIGMFPPGVLQFAVLGYCILQDKNPVKRYPRWLGYLNIWIALLSMPGALLPFFHDGPFTWRGLIGFWMVAVAFFTWIITMWWMTLRAIDISEKLEPSTAGRAYGVNVRSQ
jgi:hypothetical protein